MLQSLLEDRFQLRLHHETRELPVYDLVVAKPGKMKLSEDQTPPAPDGPATPGTDLRGTFGMRIDASGIALGGMAIPVSTFANLLQNYVDRPVLDKTGLQGLFDIHMPLRRRTPSSPPNVPSIAVPEPPTLTAADPSGAPVFTAVQEELGLRLDSGKATVTVLVIDSVFRPSSN